MAKVLGQWKEWHLCSGWGCGWEMQERWKEVSKGYLLCDEQLTVAPWRGLYSQKLVSSGGGFFILGGSKWELTCLRHNYHPSGLHNKMVQVSRFCGEDFGVMGLDVMLPAKAMQYHGWLVHLLVAAMPVVPSYPSLMRVIELMGSKSYILFQLRWFRWNECPCQRK